MQDGRCAHMGDKVPITHSTRVPGGVHAPERSVRELCAGGDTLLGRGLAGNLLISLCNRDL